MFVDGELKAAAQEERYSRRKHEHAFPEAALRDCLQMAGARLAQVHTVVFAEKPWRTALHGRSGRPANGFARWLGRLYDRGWWPGRRPFFPFTEACRPLLPHARIRYAWHHHAHLAAAFHAADCERAAFLVLDGIGEDTNASFGRVDAGRIDVLGEAQGPAGLGLFYQLLTRYLGFPSFGSEYKVMGLAPYGQPRYVQVLRGLLECHADGYTRVDFPISFRAEAMAAGTRRVEAALGQPARAPAAPLEAFHSDVACSLQALFEERFLAMARHVRLQTGLPDLVVSGGCAQNCVALGRLRQQSLFERVHVSAASSDMGDALGAALLHLRERGTLRQRRIDDRGWYLGGEPGAMPEAALPHEVAVEALYDQVARLLAEGQIVGWCEGRMELGARALGARSILADARVPDMQSRLNLAVKFREGFRPFAPMILESHVADWFECAQPSRYMQFVDWLKPERRLAIESPAAEADWRARLAAPRCAIPSVVHVDHSARLQTVHPDVHPQMHRLLSAFHALTGVPLLINTSFNVSGEPIVRTAEDAWQSFIHTDIDWLVCGGRLYANPRTLSREEKRAWVDRFAASA